MNRVTVYNFDVLLSQFECMYMESRIMVMVNLFSGQQWRSRHREQTYGHMGREEGEGKIMERVTWKLTIRFVKYFL